MTGNAYLSWPDYLVLAVMLVSSAAIGFYYACTGGKQRTTKEYLLADRGMHWFPVACSLVASFVSSQTLIGLPGEVYAFGTIILVGYLFKPIGVIIAAKFYLPVLVGLNSLSIYKYVELRFGKIIKYALLFSALVNAMFYCAMVVYGPALSLSAVTGINIWLSVMGVAVIATLYTVVGGLKAVLWADTLQLIIMIAGCVVVLIYGVVVEGGLTNVWQVNLDSGRLDFLDTAKLFDFDPRMRHTIWGVGLHGLTAYIGVYASQPTLQRAMAIKDEKGRWKAFGLTAFMTCWFGLWCGFLGLVIFAYNKYCDPIENGEIFSKDQQYPLYLLKLLGHLPGLTGLILSSIFSASLSTLSTMLTSVTANILQDFVKPLRPNITDRAATIVSKVTSLALGGFTVLLVLFVKNFGVGLFSMGMTILGTIGSPTLSLFTVGIFVPIVNYKGAIIGYLAGIAYSGFMGIGGLINQAYIYKYPVTTAGCNITDTSLLANISSPLYDPSTWDPQSHYRSGVNAFFDLSYTWIGIGGGLVCAIFSILFSILLAKKDDPLVSKKLLSPYVLDTCCLMPKYWRDKIDYTDDDEEEEVDKVISSSLDEKELQDLSKDPSI